ncbi:MAG TPA: mechanosensitive ion channel family protein [Vicinamibacterales bacterium]|nr:mechanosensitive ion channel family protein [Vicinamibacterales bacterium]
MLLGFVLFAAAVVLRTGSTNRHVRGRLLVSAIAFALQALLAAAAATGYLPVATLRQEQFAEPLLLAFGAINALVAVVINPWRSNRLPDRFPTIVQDSIVITLFAVAATVVLQERILAATAVSAVVLGLALQDTLGNFFAGLAIQIEKPFSVGHWVSIRGADGMVSEITWRATKMRTKAGNFVIVPNSVLSKDTIVNYSEPTLDTRLELELGVSYDVAPNRVKSTILHAIKDQPLISGVVAPEVLIVNFNDSSITYRIRVWTTDFGADDRLRDRIRSAVYYAFRRSDIVIPYPIRTVIMKEAAAFGPDAAATEVALRKVSIFASLPDEQRAQIAAASHRGLYAAGEAIVRQGEPGGSMFVVLSGEAAVLLEPADREVARIPAGGFFGEMSLLTGASRNATVRTTVDSEMLEITADGFRQFVLANPAAVEQMGVAVANRQAELDQARSHGATPVAREAPQGLVDRIRRFFGITAS